MSKNAVYSPRFYDFYNNTQLKRLSLLFDKIYINRFHRADANEIPNLEKNANSTISNMVKRLHTEAETFVFLEENGIIEQYESEFASRTDIATKEEKNYINTFFEHLEDEMNEAPVLFSGQQLKDKWIEANTVVDIQKRVDAVELSKKYQSDFFPVLTTSNSFSSTGTKNEVLKFILSNIPEPDINTPWQDIIDFRKDDDARRKYLALVQWVNKVSSSNSTLNEIKEEYEFLYGEFMNAFKLHKMKYKNGVLEIVTSVGDTFTSSLFRGKVFSAIKGLFDIRTAKINLLLDEGNCPGKEIAYINAANEIFKKKEA